MKTLLAQMNAVPGVVGSLVSATDGTLLADAFPPVFDTSGLAEASRTVAESVAGLETVTGPSRLIDLRYGSARILVRPVAGANLLFLCSPALNVQTLAISASVVAPKLEKLVASGPAPAAPERKAGRLFEAVQRIDAIIRRKGLEPFKARGAIALKAGFGLGFIDEDTPDDADQLAKLRAAATAVLGESP